MSKPKRRSMRRLKRTLGVTALILALLIAAIPDVGHAESTITASLAYEWTDTVQYTGDEYFSGVDLSIVGPEITSTFGGPTDYFKLIMYHFEDASDTALATGYETHIHRYTFKLLYVPSSKVSDNSSGSIGGIGRPVDSIGRAVDYSKAEDIASNNEFSLNMTIRYDFNNTYKYKAPFYMSVYKNNSGDALKSSDLSEPTRNSAKAELTVPVTFNGDEANQGFTLDVYMNTSPKEYLNISDDRGYSYGESGLLYMIPDIDTHQGNPPPAAKVDLQNIDRNRGVKELYIPSTDYYLHIKKNGGSETGFTTIANNNNFSGVSNYTTNTIDLIDWIDLSILDNDEDRLTYTDFYNHFNDYQLLIAFPKTNADINTAPYAYRERKSEDRDEYRVAYLRNNTWYDLGEDEFIGYNVGYFNGAMHSITLDLDGLVDQVVVYIARGDRNIIPVDNRGIVGGNSFNAEVVWNGKTEDDLLKNVYVQLDDVTSAATADITREVSALLDEVDEVYTTDYEVLQIRYTDDEDGLIDASDIFTAGDEWWDYTYTANMTTATPNDWDYNADDSDGVLYGKVKIYGSKDNGVTWTLLNTVEDATAATFSTDRETDIYGYYILIYSAFVDETVGIMYGDDARTETLSGWRYDAAVGSETLKPWHGELPAGTYWVKVASTYNNGADTYIYRNLGNWSDVTDAYSARAYYTMSMETGKIGSAHIPMDYSKYRSVTGDLRIQMALPVAMSDAVTGEVILILYNTDTGESYEYNNVTIEDRSIEFSPTGFSAPLEVALFYNPGGSDPEVHGFFYQYISSTGNWVKNATAGIAEEDIGTKWTLYFREPSYNDPSMAELETRIADDFGDTLRAEIPIDYFDLTLWETNITENRITDIGTNEITVSVPISSAQTGDKVYVYAYNRNDGDDPISVIRAKTLTASGNTIEFPVTTDTLQNLNPYAIVLIPAEEAPTGLRVEDYSGISNTNLIDASPEPDDTFWILRIEKNVDSTDSRKTRLKNAFAQEHPEAGNDAQYYFFDIHLYENEVADENLITDIGSKVLTVTVPVPSDAQTGDTVYLWKYDNSELSAEQLNRTTGDSLTFNITQKQLEQWRPYMLVVIPAEQEKEKEKYPLRVDDSESSLTSYAGGASSPTEIEGQKWKLVIKDDFADTAVIKGKLVNYGGVYEKEDVLVFPYDIRLCYDYGLNDSSEVEVTAADYNDTEVTVTLPFPLELQNKYKSGDAIELHKMYRSGSRLMKLVSDAEVNPSEKTLTFRTRDILTYDPYAIVYIPQEEVDPNADDIEVISWPTAVPTPDSGLSSGADFMQLVVDLPTAKTNATDHKEWKLLVSQYVPDGVADSTALAVDLRNPQLQIPSIYKAGDSSDVSTSAATVTSGNKTTVTTTTTTTTTKKSIIKVYNLELWEYDDATKNYTKKVSNDYFNRSDGIGVSITIPLNGALVNNNGEAEIWTMNPDSNRPDKVLGSVHISGAAQECTFTTYHFSQYAIIYTPVEVNVDSQSETSDSGNSGTSSSGSSGNSGSNNNNSNNTGASNSATSGTNTGAGTGGNGTGGGGNRASGDNSVDMPRTADATTYKAIFILILLAFGAFELISSMPVKQKAKARRRK